MIYSQSAFEAFIGKWSRSSLVLLLISTSRRRSRRALGRKHPQLASLLGGMHGGTSIGSGDDVSWLPDSSFHLAAGQRVYRGPAVGSDIDKAVRAYARCPVPGMEIKRIEFVYSQALEDGYRARLNQLDEHKGDVFKPHWHEEDNAEWRGKVAGMLDQLCEPHQDPSYPRVKIVPAFHGTSEAAFASILAGGYEALSLVDQGFLGRALYFTFDAEYAFRVYARGSGVLVMNWVCFSSAYPVVGDGDFSIAAGACQKNGDMPKMYGGPHWQNYDAHFAGMVAHPGDPHRAWYYPVKPNESPEYTELAVFQPAQVTPRFVFHLQACAIPALPCSESYGYMLRLTAGSGGYTLQQIVDNLKGLNGFQLFLREAAQEVERRHAAIERTTIREAAGGNVSAYADLQFGGELGRGGFAVVYQAVRSSDGTAVAYKKLKDQDDAAVKRMFTREVAVMNKLCHPRIVQIYSVTENPIGIVMELMANKTLHALLASGWKSNWNWKWKWSLDVCCGMQFMHSQGVLHRDLKAENVLLDGSWTAKIGDLGLSVAKSSMLSTIGRHSSVTTVGTTPWMAPELVVKSKGQKAVYCRATDVYSFGMFLYELLTHKTPWELDYPGERGTDLFSSIYGSFQRQERPRLVEGPREFVDLIAKCWQQNAIDRPSLKECMGIISAFVKAEMQAGLGLGDQAAAAAEKLAAEHAAELAKMRKQEEAKRIAAEEENRLLRDQLARFKLMEKEKAEQQRRNDEELARRLQREEEELARKDKEAEDRRKQEAAKIAASGSGGDGAAAKATSDPSGTAAATVKAFEDLRHEGVVAGGEGKAVGQFNCPYCIDVDAHDNVFVPDFHNHRVQAVNSAGRAVCSIGSEGQGDGMFDGPSGVAVDRRRSLLYVADCLNDRIQVLAITYDGTKPSLRFVGKFGSCGSEKAMLQRPCDIAVSTRSGHLYVAEAGDNNRIQVFTSDGNHVCFIDGRKLLSPMRKLKVPAAIAVDDNDTCYVADSGAHRVLVFSADGSLLRRFGCEGNNNGEFDSPQSICMDDKRGLIIVGDCNSIQAFNKDDCSFVGKLRDQTFVTIGVCVDSLGRIVASNINDHTIERFS